MGLKGKSKLDELEMPKFDVTPVIPDDEEELDRQIKEMVGDDPVVNKIFEKAEKNAELNATSCDATHKLGCLQLVRNELADTRRVLWWALFEMQKTRKALEVATASSDKIVTGITDNIVKAQHTPLPVKLAHGEEASLKQHREALIEKEMQLMDERLKQFQEKLDAHYNRLAGLRWGNQDGLAIHGKWVKWIVGIALTSFLCTISMLVFGIVILIDWLA